MCFSCRRPTIFWVLNVPGEVENANMLQMVLQSQLFLRFLEGAFLVLHSLLQGQFFLRILEGAFLRLGPLLACLPDLYVAGYDLRQVGGLLGP